MAIDRWFNVLVLGGAALAVVGCPESEPEDSPSGGDGGGGAQAASSSGSTSTASSSSSGGAGAGGELGSGGDGAGASAGAGGEALGCSEVPDPGDPCGCPCCWVDAPNTDPACAGFCAAGNNGAGCCM